MENKENNNRIRTQQEKADEVREEIIQAMKKDGKTDKEIQSFLDAFGI